MNELTFCPVFLVFSALRETQQSSCLCLCHREKLWGVGRVVCFVQLPTCILFLVLQVSLTRSSPMRSVDDQGDCLLLNSYDRALVIKQISSEDVADMHNILSEYHQVRSAWLKRRSADILKLLSVNNSLPVSVTGTQPRAYWLLLWTEIFKMVFQKYSFQVFSQLDLISVKYLHVENQ